MVNVVITYNKGTGMPEVISGFLKHEDDFEYRIVTTRTREFGIPKASVYRTEWTYSEDEVKNESDPEEEWVHAKPLGKAGYISGYVPGLSSDGKYANKLDIPSDVTKVYDHDGSKWTRGDFSEFWYCSEDHRWEMDAYGPFTLEAPDDVNTW